MKNTIKQYIKDAIINWYKNEYADSESFVSYHETLEKKENIHCSLIDSPFGKLFHFHTSPSTKGDKQSIFLRLDNEDIVINNDNIYLYYEFMNDDQVCKIGSTKIYLSKLHDDRLENIIQLLNIDIKILCNFRRTCIHSYYFGVRDTLKPIHEYIKEIKDSNDYKQYRFNYLVEKYDLSIRHLEQLEHELFADDISYESNIDNLIYSALDNIADDFKMNVIDYIEDNYLQEETGINCISDIEAIIKDGEFEGIFKEFESYGLNDYSVQNITMFIDRYKELEASGENLTCAKKAL